MAKFITENEAGLFRSNSTCTRFLSAFARLHGYQYLRNLVEPLIKAMQDLPSGSGYEIDPNKAIGQDVYQNQKNVEHVASTFLSLLLSSLPALPWWARSRRYSSYLNLTKGFQDVPRNMYAYREGCVSLFLDLSRCSCSVNGFLALKCGRSRSMQQWALLSF